MHTETASLIDIVTLIANISLALSFLVGLIFGIAQVKAAARDRRERLTLETLREFQTSEFIELLHFVSFHNLPVDWEGFKKLSAGEQMKLIQFAQEMESLGILVSEKLINIELVDKTLGSFVATAWKKYKPMYIDMRVAQPDPFLGEYFQWLAEQINVRMKENPRRPFHETAGHK